MPSVPDLVAATFAPVGTTTLTVGAKLTFNYLVRNDGGAAAGAFNTTFRLAKTEQIDSGATLLAQVARKALAVKGSFGSTSAQATVPKVAPGTYYVGMHVDEKAQVKELNEANNKRMFKVTVVADNYCDAGSCCDVAAKKAKPLGTKCHAKIQATEYRCFGNQRQKRDAYGGCNGTSGYGCQPTNSAFYAWTSFKTYGSCTGGLICRLASKTKAPTCGKPDLPDLHPDYLAPFGTSTVEAGKVLVARYRLRNLGTASSGAFAVDFRLSTNALISTADTLLSGFTKTSMGPGTSYGVYSRALTIPSDTKTGTYYIGVMLDSQSKVKESNENNNKRYFVVQVKGAACTSGVCCDAANKVFRPKGYKCGVAVVGTEYRCLGTKTAQRRLGFGGCAGNSVTCSTAQSNVAWSSWTTTQNCSSGTVCKLASKTTPPTCINPNTQLPDLLADFFESAGPVVVPTKQPVWLRYRLRNAGKAASGKFDVKFTLTADLKIDASDEALMELKGMQLAAGNATTTVKTNIVVPPKTTPGTWYVGVYVDYGDNVAETSESNNASFFKITVPSGGVCTSGVCCDTAKKTFRAKGAKCGATQVNDDHRCSGKNVQRRGAYLGCSGSSATVCSKLAADYYWEVWKTTKTCSAGQTCKDNGSSPATCEDSKKLPDLKPLLWSVQSAAVEAGKTAKITFRISNVGVGASPKTALSIRLSTNKVISSSDPEVGTFHVNALAAGAKSNAATGYVTIPATTKAGNYYLGLYIDIGNQVVESHELNNTDAAPLTVSTQRPSYVVDGCSSFTSCKQSTHTLGCDACGASPSAIQAIHTNWCNGLGCFQRFPKEGQNGFLFMIRTPNQRAYVRWVLPKPLQGTYTIAVSLPDPKKLGLKPDPCASWTYGSSLVYKFKKGNSDFKQSAAIDHGKEKGQAKKVIFTGDLTGVTSVTMGNGGNPKWPGYCYVALIDALYATPN